MPDSTLLPGGIAPPAPGRSQRDVVMDFIARYRFHSEVFVREALLVDVVEPFQHRALARYDTRTRRQSFRSGHGVGKTALLAWLIVHHTLFEFPQRTAVTAPTGTQLFDALVPEVARWIDRLPPLLKSLLDVKTEHITFTPNPKDSFVAFKTSRPESPEALQGVHSAEGSVLLIGDEASGIPEAVFLAAGGSMSGPNAMTILAGNPVRGEGFFYSTQTKFAEQWNAERVSVFESSFSGGEVYAKEIAEMYGENSNAYRVRVLGEFPVSEDDTVVPFEWVEAAASREVKGTMVPVLWGVDVAWMGSDRSALAKRRGNILLDPPRAWSKLECADLVGHLKTEWDTTPSELRPVSINVDIINYGACVVERLRELGLPARGVNVSETSSLKKPDVYRNLRAELWFEGLRTWFGAKDCSIPRSLKRDDNMERFIREITLPTYAFTPQSRKIYVEAKDEIKSRGYDSPDLAEAFMMTFASDAITMARGSRPFRRRAEAKPMRIA